MATTDDRMRRARRVLEIGKLMALGVTIAEIQQKVAKEHGISQRMIRKDILKVRTQWAEEAAIEGQGNLRRNQTRQLLRAIVRRAMEVDQLTAAVRGVQRLMELDGLMEPAKVELTVTGRDIRAMTPVQRRAEIDMLVARRAASLDRPAEVPALTAKVKRKAKPADKANVLQSRKRATKGGKHGKS